jgi:hypothetical protein
MNIGALVLSASVVSGAFLMAQERGTLSGQVLDPTGAAMANSLVSLRWNDIGEEMCWSNCGKRKKRKTPHKKEFTVQTDSAGRFGVYLFPGWWDVFAYSDGFVPTCRVVGVEPGKTTDIEIRFLRSVRLTLE